MPMTRAIFRNYRLCSVDAHAYDCGATPTVDDWPCEGGFCGAQWIIAALARRIH